MGANLKHRIGIVLVAGFCLAAWPLSAQKTTTSRTVRKVRIAEEINSVAPAVMEAESAMEKREFARAEKLLQGVVALDPRDYRAWFDLGFVFNVTKRRTQAIDAYRKTIALKPSVQEANLNLGLLLSAAGEQAEAAKYLRAATTLKPDSKDASGVYRAWLSLGRVLQKSAPTEAITAFRKAVELDSKDPEPHLSLAAMLEAGDAAAAEAEYKQALQLAPKSAEAIAALVNLYTRTNQLASAETFLQQYLKLQPGNVTAHLQMGRLLIKQQRPAEALQHFEIGLKNNPEDVDLIKAVAALYAANRQYPEAEVKYRSLVAAFPKDAVLRRELAKLLMWQRKFPEAEGAFMDAIRLNPKEPENYGEFAIVAAQNKNFALTIRALDERAKYAAETPATYFLRATSYDNLKAFKEAAGNYRRFLAVASGQFPDQEWQARHRLIAIEPGSRK